ncbi:MAG: SH3 domain-containing protein [Cyanobacteria bacterium SBC]|nr:SH3 domain-containing protein [Cyanobacteria bacterium SBC]
MRPLGTRSWLNAPDPMKFSQSLASIVALSVLWGLSSCRNPSETTVSDPTPSPIPSETAVPDVTVPTETPTAAPTATPTAAPTATPTPEPVEQSPATIPTTPTPEPTATPEPAEPEAAAVRVVSCLTTMARVDDPDAPLNVRSTPQVADGNIIGQLDNGVFVSIEGEEGDWWKISDPVPGWIFQNLTDSGCNEKVARVEFATNTASATLRDRFIGAGIHQYYLDAFEGQTMTLTATEGPLPLVMSPTGKELTGGAGMQNQLTWSGQLPQNGEYTLEFPSNFRGYEYTTTVEIQ